jgi:Family of unknown function (DUF5760)
MDSDTLKGQLIHNYLNQQLTAVGGDGNFKNDDNVNALQPMDLPDNEVLDEFKQQVRMYNEIDNQIIKLFAAVKERKAIKKQLTEKILKFMGRYNIEDLNTKDGKLRYRTTTVKPTVSKTEIKQRLIENYGKVQNIEELTTIIFAHQEPVQKATLRRLRPSGNNGLSV